MQHTIITTHIKFALSGWNRSIENNGGYPVIKYTATDPANVQFLYSTKYTATGNAVSNIIEGFPAGSEILVIGDTIHFPANIMKGPAPTPLLNYLPKAPLP